ncbi:hypothetical protein KM043_016008 [Ampulex compressa]|nr:hypothetical protein KM043_016008 [Ampulex compressa]
MHEYFSRKISKEHVYLLREVGKTVNFMTNVLLNLVGDGPSTEYPLTKFNLGNVFSPIDNGKLSVKKWTN